MLILRFIFWLIGIWKLYRIPAFKKKSTKEFSLKEVDASDVSIIIPARNEEKRLPHLLKTISQQTVKPLEVIIVDDHSEDKTFQITQEAGYKAIKSSALPSGWQGKSWACWTGAKAAQGKTLMFLDADTRLEPHGLEEILSEYKKEAGPLSIQPYSIIEKPYENLTAFFSIIMMMGTNLFTPLGRRLKATVFFGPCQVMEKEDYLKVGGHAQHKGEILEDIALGQAFSTMGIPIRCMGGKGAIKVGLYPEAIGDLIDGYSKNFASGALAVRRIDLVLIIMWISGAVGTNILTAKTVASFTFPDGIFVIGLFLLYGIQIYWILMRIGSYSPWLIFLYPLALLFFIVIFIRALYLAHVLEIVNWKGRAIQIKQKDKD